MSVMGGGEAGDSGDSHLRLIGPCKYAANPCENSWVNVPDNYEGGEMSENSLTILQVELISRIGVGSHGDSWLANVRSPGEEGQKKEEIVVKVLPESVMSGGRLNKSSQTKLETVLQALQGCHQEEVGTPLFAYTQDGKAGLAFKKYSRSWEDIISRRASSCLPPHEAYQSALSLCKSLRILHSKGVLALNLKPSNVFVMEKGASISGAFGLPWILRDDSSSDPRPSISTDRALYYQWPSSTAPEQRKPDIHGPLSEATDVWGLACTVLEILTGRGPYSQAYMQPYTDDVFAEYFSKHVWEKHISSSLHPRMAEFLTSCFNSNPLSRPTLRDAEKVLERELGISGEANLEPQPTPTSTLFSVGDWVQFEPEWVTLSADIQHQSPIPVIGRVWAIRPDGTIDAAVVGRELLVKGFDPDDGDIEKCDGFREGQFVRPKPHIEASQRSRFVWAGWEDGRVHKVGWSMARIKWISPNGLLTIHYPGVFGGDNEEHYADPSDVEVVDIRQCKSTSEVYNHVRAIHWSIGPLLNLATALFAIRIGSVVVTTTKNQFSSRCNNKQQDPPMEVKPGSDREWPQGNTSVGKGKYEASLKNLQDRVSGAVAPTLCKMMNAGRKEKAQNGVHCNDEK